MTDLPHAYRPDLIDNPEWDAVLTRQAELYIEDFKRRENPEREPARMHVALGILGLIFVACALIGAVTG
jgi:hypothetical protein